MKASKQKKKKNARDESFNLASKTKPTDAKK